MKRPLPRYALPGAIVLGAVIGALIVWNIIASVTADKRVWPDVNNGVHTQLGTPPATGHYFVTVTLGQITAPADAIKGLGFDPAAHLLGADEGSIHSVSSRIMDAVRANTLTETMDATVTGPNAMTFIFTYPGDPNNPFAAQPSTPQVLQTAQEPILGLQQPAGTAWSFLVTPHLLSDGRFYSASQISTSASGSPPLNSWSMNGEAILLASISCEDLVSMNGHVVDSKQGGVHLVMGTISLVKSR